MIIALFIAGAPGTALIAGWPAMAPCPSSTSCGPVLRVLGAIAGGLSDADVREHFQEAADGHFTV